MARTAEQLLALARVVDEFDMSALSLDERRFPTCQDCHDDYRLGDGMDATALCNTCAQDAVTELSRELLRVQRVMVEAAKAVAKAHTMPTMERPWEPPGGLKRPRKNYRRDGSRGRR